MTYMGLAWDIFCLLWAVFVLVVSVAAFVKLAIAFVLAARGRDWLRLALVLGLLVLVAAIWVLVLHPVRGLVMRVEELFGPLDLPQSFHGIW